MTVTRIIFPCADGEVLLCIPRAWSAWMYQSVRFRRVGDQAQAWVGGRWRGVESVTV